MTADIHTDAFLSHPPEKVWRALTDPDLVAAWLMPNTFEPRVGHRFTFRTDPAQQRTWRILGGGWRGQLA
ncbi:SRPBCC domain-containing protein [Polymorphospora lycopeni]|uniref:SRPBCC domain-containing protein n=1 Tax=Polymorphospora lycopeni TaxID=3140240 RepID=A0ABV5CSS5_9ACTN